MRTTLLIPLAFTSAVMIGCGGEVSKVSERDETATRAVAAPERDLTLSGPRIPATEVASAVELSAPKSLPVSTRRHHPRPRPKPAPSAAAEARHEAAPAPEPVSVRSVSEALAEAAPMDEAATGGRELAPGRTVTVIPVSSGPSVEADEGDSWMPSGPSRGVLVGGGGTCRRRGGAGGIGIAARIQVGIPALRLR